MCHSDLGKAGVYRLSAVALGVMSSTVALLDNGQLDCVTAVAVWSCALCVYNCVVRRTTILVAGPI